MSAKPYDEPEGAWNVGGLPISAAAAKAQGARVQIDKLDHVVHGQVDFITSDAQGFDLFALQGGQKAIARWRPTILIEIAPELMAHQGRNHRELNRLLHAQEY